MQIAVTTPSGNVGQHVGAMLIRAGIRPILLARRPSRLDPSVLPFVEVRPIDQFDPASAVRATRDVNALFWVDPTTGGEDPLQDYERASLAVAAAVKENGIGRVVFQSSVGAERRHGAGEIDGLAATELALDKTDADVTHLRCGYFFTNLLLQLDAIRAGTIPVLLPTTQPLPWVAPRDIAEFAVTRLLAPDWSGRHVTAVHGPAHLSWDDIAATITKATGHAVTAVRVSDETMRHTLLKAGTAAGLVEAILGMSTGLRDGFTPEQPRTTITTTPTTLSCWIYDTLPPLIAAPHLHCSSNGQSSHRQISSDERK